MIRNESRPSRSVSLPVFRQIDRICIEFETEYKRGESPSISEYLRRWQEPGNEELLRELVKLDIEYRTRSGEHPRPEDYVRPLGNTRVVLEAFDSDYPTNAGRPNDDPFEMPLKIGRYEIRELIDEGSFGQVFLGYDKTLERPVAVKVARIRNEHVSQAQLAEARVVAKLSHSSIVPVYDAGITDDGRCYLILELIQGHNLAAELKSRQFDSLETTNLVATICDAIAYAHGQGLVHRDIKPANILLNDDSTPYITDFGLALWGNQLDPDGCFIGSVAYMSPEQVRGETHLVDHRSDIFGMGVVLYELLAGRKPFEGSLRQVCEQIKNHDPLPPSKIIASVPAELDRICLRALSKLINDRYTSASDMANDLRECASTIELGQTGQEFRYTLTSIEPRGLSHFGSADANAYLALVPGPRGRDGIPEIIRTWVKRIDSADEASRCRVGIIYGPSGCGKSSLVHAGILPRIDSNVIHVSVQASQASTENDLLREIRRCPIDAPQDSELIGTLGHIRQRHGGRKLLLVIDQFEQWLHSHPEQQGTELVDALRQCDGLSVQCLLVLRNDFNIAVSRFLRELEIRTAEGINTTLIDLFDMKHAENVLACFGHSMGTLPLPNDSNGQKEHQFLVAATNGLAVNSRVAPVRLAIFLEMMKNRAWNHQTLESQGGVSGIGVRFLDDMLKQSAELSCYKTSVEEILETLLPDSDETIRGSAKSREELMATSNMVKNPAAFDRLIVLLDEKFRLVTPAEHGQRCDSGRHNSKQFALTHDFLIPSIRQWLTNGRRKTRRGRARLKLHEQSVLWESMQISRNLPTGLETMRTVALVKRYYWSPAERIMMSRAVRYHAMRLTCFVMVLSIIAGILGNKIQSDRQTLAESLVNSLIRSPAEGFPYAFARVESRKPYAVPALRKTLADPEATDEFKLRVWLALAMFGENTVPFLVDSILTIPEDECANILTALRFHKTEAVRQLRSRFAECSELPARTRYAITLLYLGERAAAEELMTSTPYPLCRSLLIDDLRRWNTTPDEIAKLMDDKASNEIQMAVGTYLGTIPLDQFSDETRSRLIEQFTSMRQNALTSDVRSIADWVLRKWSIVATNKPCPPSDQRDWHINTLAMTMVRVAPGKISCNDEGGNNRELTVARPFYLQDREVSTTLFNQFMNDSLYPGEKPKDWRGSEAEFSITDACPANNLSWEIAIQFCNWLSWREDRLPYYSRGADDMYEPVPDSNGYRLPKVDEWEYACRAGTETRFSFGDEDNLLDQYAVFDLDVQIECGSKLPNPWGFFDIHGNMREWCEEWHDDLDSDGSRQRILMGGHFSGSPKHLQSALRNAKTVHYQSIHNGLRVARNAD